MQQNQGPNSNELSLTARRHRLDEVLQHRLSRRDWRLEFYSEISAVIARGRPANHWLHALLSIVTGVWIIVWLFAIGFEDERREMIFIHASGFVETRRLR